jgi:hypothetical protein
MKYILQIAISLCLLFNLILLYLKFDQISLSNESFLELSKCPLCYGVSFCNELLIQNDRFGLYFEDTWTSTNFFNSLLNIKNVYFASDTLSDRKFVLKKLAHQSELEDFRLKELKCEKNPSANCITRLIYSDKHKLSQRLSQTSLKSFTQALGLEITTCFTQRLIDMMYENYYEYDKTEDFFLRNIALLTTLKINPEPIVLQVNL